MVETPVSRVHEDSSSQPRTPQNRIRPLESFGASPSPLSSFRNEEDAIIFEFGSRWLRAGFEGESTPLCTVGFGPDESRKVGDYRGWMKGNNSKGGVTDQYARVMDAEEWVQEHEFWRMDLRDLDLALFEDRLERAVRDIYNKYLLTDAGNARLVIVLPSIMPHPLLSTILTSLFNRWRFPTVTLLPSAPMVAAAAGLRSALVVDIGWAETTVTGIYEYREIQSKRSTRAMRMLMQEIGRMTTALTNKSDLEDLNVPVSRISTKFGYCEELLSRLAWCRPDETDEMPDSTIEIPSPSKNNGSTLNIPFSILAEPTEKILLASGIDAHEVDDHEQPVHIVVYNVLLALHPDVRGTCMSRICFTGGGSNLPGIRNRIISEVSSLVKTHGWSVMRGRAIEQQRKQSQELSVNQDSGRKSGQKTGFYSPPASEQGDPPPEPDDLIEQKLRRQNRDRAIALTPVQGVFREVESLGAWAGASLVTNLKIRGHVEIEREKFLQHGLAGASREFDHHHHYHHVPDRRSGLGSGTGRAGGDRSSWTLGGWG